MLYYQVRGQGEPVVLVHGYLENSKMWEDYANRLSQGYKVVTVDLPGHGKSKNYAEVHTMELVANKIKEILDFLNISEALVIGHSMGGYVTLALTDLFPEKVKSFILLNSSSLADNEGKKIIRDRAVKVAKENMPVLIKMSIPLLFGENKKSALSEEKEFARQMMRETSLPGVVAALIGMKERTDRTSILSSFKGEIGIVLGTQDRTVDPVAFEEVIPEKENITVIKLETGHMSYLEETERTFDFITEFAQRRFKN